MQLNKEDTKFIIEQIVENSLVIMTQHTPQDQLIAGGKLSILIEMTHSCENDIDFTKLNSNKTISKALDFVSEMRHYDQAYLRARNTKLPTLETIAREALFPNLHKKDIVVIES